MNLTYDGVNKNMNEKIIDRDQVTTADRADMVVAQGVLQIPQMPRRPWIAPTIEHRGSVANLVQIHKNSGNFDCSGSRRFTSGVSNSNCS